MIKSAQNNSKAILGIDAGGTNIKWAIYHLKGKTLDNTPITYGYITTRKKLHHHLDDISDIIEQSQTKAIAQAIDIIAIGIGTPGRFSNEYPKIKAGTSPNMGIPSGEFDNINLIKEYQKLTHIPVYVENDATVQGHALVKDFLSHNSKKEQLLEKTVGYIGIGTGIGHCIVKVKKDGTLIPITDGHASKILINLPNNAIKNIHTTNKHIEKQNTPLKEDQKISLLDVKNNMVKAEDSFSATAVKKIFEVSSDQLMSNKIPIKTRKRITTFCGQAMASLIKTIHGKDHSDIIPKHTWSPTDKKLASETSVYIIAGGLGQSELGYDIIKEAKDHLSESGINNIQIIQTKQKIATYGAATLPLNY